MNFKETVVDAVKLYFEPVSGAYFKWVVAALVILAVGVSFVNESKAAYPPTMDAINVPAMTAAHTLQPPIIDRTTVEKQSETDLYTEESHPNEYCIALNVYYEARADNLAGKYAVADVVLNRVADKRFETTPCKVIREGIYYESWKTKQHADLPDEKRIYYPKRDKCQFSWFCDGKPDEPAQMAAWRESQVIAYNIVQFGTFRGITEGATHYHATYVAPDWSLLEWRYAYHLIGRIGAHIFYKWV